MKRISKGLVSLLMAVCLVMAGIAPPIGETAEPIVTVIDNMLGSDGSQLVFAADPTTPPAVTVTNTPIPTTVLTPTPIDEQVTFGPNIPALKIVGTGYGGTNEAKDGEQLEFISGGTGTSNNMTVTLTTVNNQFDSACEVVWSLTGVDGIKLTQSTTKKNEAYITTDTPGYAMLSAEMKWKVDGKEWTKTINCMLHIKMQLLEGSAETGTITSCNDNDIYTNNKELKMGYIADQYTTIYKGSKDLIKLTTPDESEKYSHYFIRLKYIDYGSGVDAWITSGAAIAKNSTNNIKWSSDNTDIARVENGLIQAVGAGFTTVRASITYSQTINNTTKTYTDEFVVHVLVDPIAQLDTNREILDTDIHKYFTNKKYSWSTKIAENNNFNIITNISNVSDGDIEWKLEKIAGSTSTNGETLNISKNDYMNITFTETNVINISNAKAGIYNLTGTIKGTQLGSQNDNPPLKMRIIVPIKAINDSDVYMCVGDVYDFANNSNVDVIKQISIVSFDTRFLEQAAGSKKFHAIEVIDSTPIVFAYNINNSDNNNVPIYGTSLKPLERDALDYALTGATGSATSIYGQDQRINVHIVDSISLNTKAETIAVGSTLNLVLNPSVKFVPIEWTSSDEKIATVDENGVVTGVAPGEAVITASQVVNGVTKTSTCRVTVVPTVTGITLYTKPEGIHKIDVGAALTVHAKIEPATNNVKLHWRVSNEEVISITEEGNIYCTITALKGGTAVVYAINADNIVTASYTITVQEPIQQLILSETEVVKEFKKGDYFHLYATVLPASASESEVTWKSLDEKVVTVDQHGKVTIVGVGSTSIMVASKGNLSEVSAFCKVTITKTVTGIKLDTKTKNMYVGETFRLTYTLQPADAATTAVDWSSTDAKVASVDATGLVTARSVGTTVIIAKTKTGGYMAMCTVTVERAATAVKLDVTDLTLNVGDYYYLETTVTPPDATDANVSFQSSDTGVAVVSKRGRVTGKKAGTCIIMAQTKSGSTAYCKVTVLQGVTGIALDQTEVTIEVGEDIELTPIFTPKNASNQNVTWASSKPSVAFVNEKGEVTGMVGGTAVITCTAEEGGYVAHCVVTVNEFVSELKLSENSYRLGIGRTHRLTATINAETATNKELKWRSSDPSIVTVDANGRIKGIKYGNATITCTAADGSGAEDYCMVEVVDLVTSIELNETYLTLIKGRSFKLEAVVNPSTATYSTPIWTSNDNNIAIVNSKGVITALNAGDCIITAAADDSSGVSEICYVHVIDPVPATGITLQETEVIMAPGEKKTVGITLRPVTSTDEYKWSCDNTAVADVDEETGIITAKSLGTANITVMTDSGQKATIKVYVVGLSRSYVELQQYTSLLLRLEVDGATTGLNVRWDVDNQEIANVTNGRVTSRALGTTTVYAVVNGRRLACTVKVVKIK